MSAAQATRIARIIREERERAGLTQEQLGRRIYATGSLISRLETGDVRPTVDTLQHLAAALRSERLMREAARLVSPAFVAPTLDGAVDLHRSNVAAKWSEEAEEARAALHDAMPVLVRPPERWSSEERQQIARLVEQLIDLERATEYLVAALCRADGLDVARAYSDHDRKLQARGYTRRAWQPAGAGGGGVTMPRPLPPTWPVRGVMLPNEPIFDGREVRQRHGRDPVAQREGPAQVGDGVPVSEPTRAAAQAGHQRPAAPILRLAFGVREAARVVGVSHSAITREIAAGRLKAKRYGRRVLIRPRDLREWLDSLPDARKGDEDVA